MQVIEKAAFTGAELKQKTAGELVELFKTLPAPELGELQGEYRATILDQGNPIKNWIANMVLYSPLLDGEWGHKAFTSHTGASYGRGYNTFYKGGDLIRKYPMKTSIGRSRYDGGPIFQLDYTGFESLLGAINMVDEIRKLGPDMYLGIGTWGFTDAMRMEPLPFLLEGPAEPFVATDKDHKVLTAKYTA